MDKKTETCHLINIAVPGDTRRWKRSRSSSTKTWPGNFTRLARESERSPCGDWGTWHHSEGAGETSRSDWHNCEGRSFVEGGALGNSKDPAKDPWRYRLAAKRKMYSSFCMLGYHEITITIESCNTNSSARCFGCLNSKQRQQDESKKQQR